MIRISLPLLITIALLTHMNMSWSATPAQQENSDTFQKLDPTSIFTNEEQKVIASKQVFKVCNVIQQAQEDASLNIVKIIADKSGLKLKATPLMSWALSLESLKNGECDILPWATKTKARSRSMNFTRPYVRIKRVVITRKEEFYFRDLDEVSDKTFVMLRGNHAVAQVKSKYPTIKFVYVDTVQDEVDYISNSKAFGSIVTLYSAANLFNNTQQKELKVSGVLPSSYDDIESIATRKEDVILHSILEKSLIATDPRRIDEFMTDGAVVSFDPEVNYRNYWEVSIAVILLVCILAWWNRYLKIINSRLTASQEKLELLSITDPLTKVFNRLKMDEVFSREIKTSDRYHSALSVIMLDVDHFKKINDSFGHSVGDSVLIKIVETLKCNLRTNDFLGRWGGEEFIIVCPSTDIHSAETVAEKLRQSLEDAEFSPLNSVTASFGIAQWQADESQESLISRADSALYRSKESGRNKISR